MNWTRLVSFEGLPQLRAEVFGCRWRSRCEIHMGVIDLEPEVRERIVEELRPDVTAMWSDPRERMGLL